MLSDPRYQGLRSIFGGDSTGLSGHPSQALTPAGPASQPPEVKSRRDKLRHQWPHFTARLPISRSSQQNSVWGFERGNRDILEKHQAFRVPGLLFPVDQQSERLNTARENGKEEKCTLKYIGPRIPAPQECFPVRTGEGGRERREVGAHSRNPA